MAKKTAKKPIKKKPLPKKKPVKAAARKTAPKTAKKVAKPVKKPAKAAKPVKAKLLAKTKKKAAPEPKVKAKATAKVAARPVAKPAVEKMPKAPKAPKAPPVEPLVEPLEEEVAEELVLTDAEGRRFCRVRDCDQLAAVEGYCRYHYLLYWKKIQVRKKILTEGKLERYIEDLTARYPDKFLDMLRKDLRSEKEFLIAIQELEIDESAIENELEEEAQTYIDEVRGMEPAARETEEDF